MIPVYKAKYAHALDVYVITRTIGTKTTQRVCTDKQSEEIAQAVGNQQKTLHRIREESNE